MLSDDPGLLWPRWPDLLKEGSTAWFIAQGTLVNRHSIGETVGRANLHGPVTVRGVRRIFNFALTDENYVEHGGRYERSREERHCATLNIVHTGNERDAVNGILFSTSSDDIDALADREYGYDLLPVETEDGGRSVPAYMFIARRDSAVIGHRVRDDILPNESSVSICLFGAATYGQDFLSDWIDSCLVADGTPLMDNPYCRAHVATVLDQIAFQTGPDT